MKKEELLNRLSDVVDFYVSEHDNMIGTKKEKEEIDKNIEAVEDLETWLKKNY